MKLSFLYLLGLIGPAVTGTKVRPDIYMYEFTNAPGATLSDKFEATFKDVISFNPKIIIMAFLGTNGANTEWQTAGQWEKFTEDQRKSYLQRAHDKGAKLIVSVGGAGYDEWTKLTAAVHAKTLGDWVTKYHLDGIDLDIEGGAGTQAPTYIVEFGKAFRSQFPSLYLTTAPQSPWFIPQNLQYCEMFTLFDRVFIQYYNQNWFDQPTSCTAPCTKWPTLDGYLNDLNGGVSLKQIIKQCNLSGKSLEALTFGRPLLQKTDGNSNEAATFGGDEVFETVCRAQKELKTNGEVMLWEWKTDTTRETRLEQMNKIVTKDCPGTAQDAEPVDQSRKIIPTQPKEDPVTEPSKTSSPSTKQQQQEEDDHPKVINDGKVKGDTKNGNVKVISAAERAKVRVILEAALILFQTINLCKDAVKGASSPHLVDACKSGCTEWYNNMNYGCFRKDGEEYAKCLASYHKKLGCTSSY